jgi:hypothetical protein
MKIKLIVLLALVGFVSPACQTVEAPHAVAVQATAPKYLSDEQTRRLSELLPGPFPHLANATPEETKAFERMLSDAEVQVIRGVQDDTSAHARARADRVEEFDPVWDFDVALGRHFNAGECKAIDHLLSRAAPEVAAIKDAAKKHFGRARPPESGLTSNDSYPSGHSTRAFFRARILAEIAPEKKDEIVRAARAMVVNRIIAGKHHPSDCAAGIVLGTSIAEAMLESAKDPSSSMHADLEAAKKEWKEVAAKKDERVRGKPGA